MLASDGECFGESLDAACGNEVGDQFDNGCMAYFATGDDESRGGFEDIAHVFDHGGMATHVVNELGIFGGIAATGKWRVEKIPFA